MHQAHFQVFKLIKTCTSRLFFGAECNWDELNSRYCQRFGRKFGLQHRSRLDSRFSRSFSLLFFQLHPWDPVPLKSPPIARDGLPLEGGGGDGRQVTVSPLGRGRDCKRISRQTVAPSTHASKQPAFWATKPWG